MGYRRVPFAVDEWYHLFTRGIDKRITFDDDDDTARFIELLYLANDTRPIERSNFDHLSHRAILELPRHANIVSIGAYCLMGNHYHILLQEKIENGISKFMQKVGTGYTMYFNEKNDRIGSLFVGPFRSKHIGTDAYLRKVVQYIHLNPAEIFEQGWKHGNVKNLGQLKNKLLSYQTSSLPDYFGAPRPEQAILDIESIALLKDGLPPLSSVLRDAAAYYEELEKEF